MPETNFLWLILHLMATSRCQALPVEDSCSQLGQCNWISHFWGSINYEDMECLPFNKHSFAIRASKWWQNLPANAGDVRNVGSVPEVGRSPGGGHATHSRVLAWRVLMDRGAWQVTKSQTQLKWLSTHTHLLLRDSLSFVSKGQNTSSLGKKVFLDWVIMSVSQTQPIAKFQIEELC